jgi:subtilisin family serine protease
MGMTWAVLGQTGGYVHVGSDGQTNPYSGDTTADQALSILCLAVDGRPAPEELVIDYYNGWAQGAVQITPVIPGAILTSQEDGDAICADTFGGGWRLAEFHDGGGGWSFWAAGSIPLGTRVWVAINDQPANPWNSEGDMPVPAVPKFFPSDAPVPNQFLAMLPEDTASSDVEPLANALVAQYGGTIIDIFESVQGFSFTADDGQAQAMSGDWRVESVEQDTYGLEQQAEWHLDRVDQRNLPLNGTYLPNNNGAGVNIYILDTGFRRSHVEFGGRAWQAADFIRFLGDRDDCNGHGTGVGSIAGGNTVGVASGANLISIRIAGCGGNAYNPAISVFSSTIVAGLDWVARFHASPAVANVSYGFSPGFWRRWFHLRTPMDRAVRRAVDSGVVVTVAAGNEGKNADRSTPARAPEAISVSGTDWTDWRPNDFNFGKVDMFAPGVSMRMAWIGSDTTYQTHNGTSFAAPMVAGAAALYLHDHPSASPGEVRNALQTQATQGVVGNPGPGSANRLLFVNVVRPATHAGLTWSSFGAGPSGTVHVGNDGQSNPYSGDTSANASRPVLCLIVDGSPVPPGITPDFYNGWANGHIAITGAVAGSQLTSRAAADAICAGTFGAGWRMAEFHDGGGGWSYWAFGSIPTGTRFWTAINDQPANPWN